MQNYIDYKILYEVLCKVKEFISTGNRAILEDIQDELKLARTVDYSIKTKLEYKNQQDFIESSHGPKRSAVFLLNYFGEFYLHGGSLTIEDDDLRKGSASHTNTYQLELKDISTHSRLYCGNPTKADQPYDFNTVFKSQVTQFENSGKSVDTTDKPWDSYQNAYTEPYRTLDFKSAFWQDGSEHGVHYILQLNADKTLSCYKGGTKLAKKITFTPRATLDSTYYFDKYFEVLALIEFFNKHWYLTWDSFIFNSTQLNIG